MHQRHGTPSRYVASSSRDRNTGAPELATLNDSLDGCDTALHLRQSQDGLCIRRRGSTCRIVSVSATTVTVATACLARSQRLAIRTRRLWGIGHNRALASRRARSTVDAGRGALRLQRRSRWFGPGVGGCGIHDPRKSDWRRAWGCGLCAGPRRSRPKDDPSEPEGAESVHH